MKYCRSLHSLMFGFSFLAFSFFFFLILEEREVPSPQRSKWYFRPRSSWERGWAGSWLLRPVEDRRCSDGSALRGRPGTIRDGARRPPDANSQRYDFYSGCSHSRSLANSISAAPFCRWEAHLPIYPTKTAHLPFCCKILFVASIWMLFAFKEPFHCHFVPMGQNAVCQTQTLESWPPLPNHNLPCWLHIYKEGYGKMVRFLFICIFQLESLNGLCWKGS